MSKLQDHFKNLVYADMAINQAYAGDVFNNEWRDGLFEEEKLFHIKHAEKIASHIMEKK